MGIYFSLDTERERERPSLRDAGPGGFVPMRSIMLLLPQYHLLLSRHRERERESFLFLFVMLDQGDSYLCEASCFFFHNITYFPFRDRETERERPSFRNAGPGGFVPMRSTMLLLPQYHALLSRQRERDLPFVMLDQGDSYLCEASCFFLHNIIYFSLDTEREREGPSFRNAGPGGFVP